MFKYTVHTRAIYILSVKTNPKEAHSKTEQCVYINYAVLNPLLL